MPESKLTAVRGGLIPSPEQPSTDPEDEGPSWEHLVPRQVAGEDWTRFQGYMREIFSAFGMDLDTPGTRDTPRRFLRALFDATAGYGGDPKLRTAFPSERPDGITGLHNQIVEGPISFFSLCEHHSLPFHGFAYVSYIAGERIIGISKLTRLVRLFARRFTVQERLGKQVADALVEVMEPLGVAVHLEAAHLCTQMRGVREEHSHTATTHWRGAFYDDPAIRHAFLRQVEARNPWRS
jgi:GTP cyclohydrolase I